MSIAALLLTACGNSRVLVEPPNLAVIPDELMKTVAGPTPGISKLAGRPAAQAEAWGNDRSSLAVCKGRLDGLQALVRTERTILQQLQGEGVP